MICVFIQVEQQIVSEGEAEACIGKEFNPVRCGFLGGQDVWTTNVLNLGIRPDKLISAVNSPYICRRAQRVCIH